MQWLLSIGAWAAPLAGVAALVLNVAIEVPAALLGIILFAIVAAAVHHAELIALKLGEPFGTLLLALAVTIIEVGLILAVMLQTPEGAATLARDTLFSSTMMLLTGLLGACVFAGALRHKEQSFQEQGAIASLAAIATLTVLTLVLPNFTTSKSGPAYAPTQLAFVTIVSLVLYLTFLAVQTVRHRDYFLPLSHAAAEPEDHVPAPSGRQTIASILFLLACLTGVVLLSDALAPAIERGVEAIGAPYALVGFVIAALVVLPESAAAMRAALADRLQTSVNLTLGSVLATTGLTIPTIAGLSLYFGIPLELGLDARGIVLLSLTLLIAGMTLATGRTTILQGAVHLVIFGVFVFTTLVP